MKDLVNVYFASVVCIHNLESLF